MAALDFVARLQREFGRAREACLARRVERQGGQFAAAGELLDAVALGEPFVEFLTLPAYDRIDR